MGRTIWSRYGFVWVTGGFFLISLVGHWIFGWFASAQEHGALGRNAEFNGYFIEMMRDTLENWQSEFLQLIWQVGGIAMLLHVGSPQSKEGDDRMEAKLDAILRKVDRDGGDRLIDRDYARRPTDYRYVREHQS